MKKTKLLFVMLIVASLVIFSCGEESTYPGTDGGGTVSDIDGNVYQTVQIGDQLWMAENLKVTHYRNGDAIPNVTYSNEWESLSTGAYCYYDNDPANDDTYGSLYNFYAVVDSRKIAPEGWHIPTDEEIKELEMTLGMSQSEADGISYRGTNEACKLAGNSDLWDNGDLESNADFGTSGFIFLPGGARDANSSFYSASSFGYLWSSTEGSSTGVWYRRLNSINTRVYREYFNKRHGISVRCVRD